jgi:pimeloyl-ACP methyl ester carboxylesterase
MGTTTSPTPNSQPEAGRVTRANTATAPISERENREIEAANASDSTPVVFVHGLWLLPSSWATWATWADLFKQAGYAPLTPDWPDDPETVEEARANSDVLANKTLKQVADHTTEIINALDRKPAILGHSTGGLLGPLLIIDGAKDHTVPWAIANAAYKRQRRNPGVTEIVKLPNRGHSLTIDHGWHEVAQTALDFVKRFV